MADEGKRLHIRINNSVDKMLTVLEEDRELTRSELIRDLIKKDYYISREKKFEKE